MRIATSTDFSPLRLRSKVAFIDDDKEYLTLLRRLVPKRHSATFHTSPSSLEPLLQHTAASLKDEGTALRAIVGYQHTLDHHWPAKAVHRYFANPGRHDIVGVLVADDAMPAETGVSLCARHSHLGLRRALLTAVADTDKAIDAFNSQSIDLYLRKGSEALFSAFPSDIDHQLDASSRERGAALMDAVDPHMRNCLATEHVREQLNELLDELHITEYMLVGCPQGLFALDADGEKTYWIQLETSESQKSLLETVDQSGWGVDSQVRVREGKSMINFDWATQLGLSPSEVPARSLSKSPYLAAGIFLLENLPGKLRPTFPARQ